MILTSKLRMLNIGLVVCTILLSINLCMAQKNFQYGVGTHVGFVNEKLDVPIGFSLHVEYALSPKLKLKTGMEMKYQNINIPYLNYNEFSDRISIPLLIHVDLTKNKDKKWTYGLEAGGTWDIVTPVDRGESHNSSIWYGRAISLKKATHSTSPTIVFRGGLNVGRKFKNNSTVQAYLHYVRSIHDLDKIYYEFHSLRSSKPPYEAEFIRDIIDLSQNGIQMGIYYAFGFKKKLENK